MDASHSQTHPTNTISSDNDNSVLYEFIYIHVEPVFPHTFI